MIRIVSWLTRIVPALLVTDHKPLTAIFAPDKGVPPLAAARLQRWSLVLSGYQYNIEYRKGLLNANADGLSRLPRKVPDQDVHYIDLSYCYSSQFDNLPVTSDKVRKETRKDSVLSQVYEASMNGWSWSHNKQDYMKPFYSRRNEISVHQGCLMWGIRVIIPTKLREQVLEELHEGHMGIVKMKSVARSFVWWPGIDLDVERVSKSCVSCQQTSHMPPVAPIHPWVFPPGPWNRVHLDYAGPCFGSRMFLVV